MKVPFSRQRVVSSSAQQMVDRSLVVTELNLDRDVGVQFFSKDLFGTGRLGYALGGFEGDGRNRQGRTSGSPYTARIESWPFGVFDDYVEGELSRLPTRRVALGANVAYNQNTNRPRSTIGDPYPAGDFDYTHAGVDILVKKRGCATQAEWMYRQADRDSNGRVGHLAPSHGRTALVPTSHELVVGVGHHVREHNLKLQTDYVHEAASGRHIHQVRSQLQMFF
jgi:phosphate-selective porin OprO/OprP